MAAETNNSISNCRCRKLSGNEGGALGGWERDDVSDWSIVVGLGLALLFACAFGVVLLGHCSIGYLTTPKEGLFINRKPVEQGAPCSLLAFCLARLAFWAITSTDPIARTLDKGHLNTNWQSSHLLAGGTTNQMTTHRDTSHTQSVLGR